MILSKNSNDIFKCECCNTVYNDIPLCFGSEFPKLLNSIPKYEWSFRVELEKSLCVVDEKHFFHRGRLTIPINDNSDDLSFDIWTTISEENFDKRIDSWNNIDRVNNEPYFGWIQNDIIPYKDTINLKSVSIEIGINAIPDIKIVDENHQLYKDQNDGITFAKAKEIIQQILKDQHK